MSEAGEFERERPRLTAIAARLLGSTAEADDVVQEAWLRLMRSASIEDPPAWLTTVVTRLCLDRLRQRRTRARFEGAASIAADAQAPDPHTDALVADQVGEAMRVVVDVLVPAERAAFVLHDVFGYPFADVATMLGRSDAAARQLASRARRKLQGIPEPAEERTVAEHDRRIVDAFLRAARTGELGQLMELLAPDAVMHADRVGQEMGAEPIYAGAAAVAARFSGGARGASRVWIDGDPGAAWIANGTAKVAFLFRIDDGMVRQIELIADPDVLATMEIGAVES